jgi:hypothetical protein
MAVLKVCDNLFKWLPAELGQLPKLTHLYVRHLGPLDLVPDLSLAALRKSTADDRWVAV